LGRFGVPPKLTRRGVTTRVIGRPRHAGRQARALSRMRDHHPTTGRSVRRLAWGLAVCLLLVGCRANKQYDLIEAELRTRNRELADTRAALERAQARAPEPHPGPVPEQAPSTGAPNTGCSIREITLGRGTGGIDDDTEPGDEALMVVIVPTDEDKSAVKVPARASIVAWEINKQGLRNPVGTWEISPDQLRPTWRAGLLATGYFVPLAWQTLPSFERVRVAVRLTTLSGQVFEADRDITVRLVYPATPRRATVPSTPITPMPPVTPRPGGREPLLPGAPPTGVPPGVEELPPPMGMTTPQRGARLLPPVEQ